MNERIKELNLQAMSIVMNGNDPDGDIEQMYIPSEFTKKFAELIVRECMKCSDPLVSHYINTHTEQEQAPLLAAIADYSSEIKKNFGVAE